MTYGGLNEQSMMPPPENRSDFRGNRWKVTNTGGFFEVRQGGAVLRPGNTDGAGTAAKMYTHSPGVELRPPDIEERQVKLWVNEIVLSWGLEYKQSQTVYGKSFYPKHVRYNDVIVRGQTASQRHYDEIVSYVVSAQEEALYGTSDVVRFELPRHGYIFINGEYKAMSEADKVDPTKIVRKQVMYAELAFDGYLLGIASGHRKGVFNPDFELRFAVVAYPGDSLIKSNSTRSASEIAEEYRASLNSRTYGEVSAPDQVFETGYGPGGNLGPR